MAQDDYYYEIQLTNKQLVFYFMAGATGLILSFLAGVMVGRGVDQTAGEVQAARPVAEERIVTEESPKPVAAPVEDLTYAQRLESDKTDDALARPKAGAPAARPARATACAARRWRDRKPPHARRSARAPCAPPRPALARPRHRSRAASARRWQQRSGATKAIAGIG